MEYLDDALGPVFDFLTSSGLDQSTYLMFTADNGPAVYADENSPQKKRVSQDWVLCLQEQRRHVAVVCRPCWSIF
jgi:arylsulfatase A-like enzyme